MKRKIRMVLTGGFIYAIILTLLDLYRGESLKYGENLMEALIFTTVFFVFSETLFKEKDKKNEDESKDQSLKE